MTAETERDEEHRRVGSLFRRYRLRGDRTAREALIVTFLPFSRGIARRYQSQHVALDDLSQVAAYGLIKAVDRYEPARGIPFTRFAYPTIEGELRRHLRDQTWMIRPPRPVIERALRVAEAQTRLRATLGREAVDHEIASHLGIHVDDVRDGFRALDARSLRSVDATGDAELDDAVGVDDGRLAEVEDALAVEHLVSRLPSRDRRIVMLRFVTDLSQAEIGHRVGVSQMHVSRTLRKALAEARSRLEHDPVSVTTADQRAT